MLVVTGGAGFIGSALVWALNQRGRDDLLIVDTLGSDSKWKNLRGKRFLRIVAPDVFLESLDELDGQIDGILHIGAITDTAATDADAIYLENTVFTRDLTEYAIASDTRFVYASSASVYGDGAFGFSDDDSLTPNLLPMNPYAFSKWLSDMDSIREGWVSQVASLRFFNVFGPNEYHKGFMASVVWHLFNQVRDSGQVKLFQSHKEGCADGEQSRDFIYVKDICNVVLWFLDHPDANGIFNLGTGKSRTYNDLAAAIFGAVGKQANISYVPTPESIRNAYQYYTKADLTKLRQAGYADAFTSLEDAVRDYVTQYLQNEANPYL